MPIDDGPNLEMLAAEAIHFANRVKEILNEEEQTFARTLAKGSRLFKKAVCDLPEPVSIYIHSHR